jgi:hypothetical protein
MSSRRLLVGLNFLGVGGGVLNVLIVFIVSRGVGPWYPEFFFIFYIHVHVHVREKKRLSEKNEQLLSLQLEYTDSVNFEK